MTTDKSPCIQIAVYLEEFLKSVGFVHMEKVYHCVEKEDNEIKLVRIYVGKPIENAERKSMPAKFDIEKSHVAITILNNGNITGSFYPKLGLISGTISTNVHVPGSFPKIEEFIRKYDL